MARVGCVGAPQHHDLLERRHVTYDRIDVSDDCAMRLAIVQRSGHAELPQIFIDGNAIGGYDELASLDRHGGLVALAA